MNLPTSTLDIRRLVMWSEVPNTAVAHSVSGTQSARCRPDSGRGRCYRVTHLTGSDFQCCSLALLRLLPLLMR